MSDVTVPRGGRIRAGTIPGDLVVERGATVDAEGPAGVNVSGNAEFRGNAVVNGPFQCARLALRDGSVRVSGNLAVGGDIEGRKSKLDVAGNLVARHVDVDRELTVRGTARGSAFEVGGFFHGGSGVEADSVQVGATFDALGKTRVGRVSVGGRANLDACELGELDVGGGALLSEGVVRGAISVGGTFEARRRLEFGSITVGGLINLGGGGKGGSLRAGGRLRVGGDLEFEEIAVGGTVDLAGNASGDRLEVGGSVRVQGFLRLQDQIRAGGSVSVSAELAARSVEIGGSLEARRAELREKAEVGGRVITEAGLRASSIELGRHAIARGALIADRVEIGGRSNAEGIFAGIAIVGSHCRVGRIVADEVEVGSGSEVGQVQYVRTLKLGRKVSMAQPAVKVERRPAPPP